MSKTLICIGLYFVVFNTMAEHKVGGGGVSNAGCCKKTYRTGQGSGGEGCGE